MILAVRELSYANAGRHIGDILLRGIFRLGHDAFGEGGGGGQEPAAWWTT